MVNLRGAAGTLVIGLLLLGCGPTTDGGSNASAGAASGGNAGAGGGGATLQGGASNNGSGGGVAGTGVAGTGAAGTGTGATSAGHAGTGGAEDSEHYIGTLQVARTATPVARILPAATFDLVEQAAWDALAQDGGSCLEETFGACVIAKCPVGPDTEPNLPNPPSTDRLDAGTITMTADVGNFSSTGKPTNADHGYAFDVSGSLTGAELVTISATGGTVSAFSTKIQLPLAPLLLTPSLAGSPGAVDVPVARTADFTFTWDARGAEKLQLSVSGSGSTFLTCKLDAASGTGTFQVGALSQLPAGTRIRLFSVQEGTVETAEGAVRVLAAFETISADKASFPTFVLE